MTVKYGGGGGTNKYIKEKYRPDVARFGDNLTRQNDRWAELGSTVIGDQENLEAFLQSVNVLQTLMAGWVDKEYKDDIKKIKAQKQKTIPQKVNVGYKTLAALMRLQRRVGFQGQRYAEGYAYSNKDERSTEVPEDLE